jgi:hypothetical protein
LRLGRSARQVRASRRLCISEPLANVPMLRPREHAALAAHPQPGDYHWST